MRPDARATCACRCWRHHRAGSGARPRQPTPRRRSAGGAPHASWHRRQRHSRPRHSCAPRRRGARRRRGTLTLSSPMVSACGRRCAPRGEGRHRNDARRGFWLRNWVTALTAARGVGGCASGGVVQRGLGRQKRHKSPKRLPRARPLPPEPNDLGASMGDRLAAVPPFSSAAPVVAGRLAVSCYSSYSFSSPDIARRKRPDAQPSTPQAAVTAVRDCAQLPPPSPPLQLVRFTLSLRP